MFYNLLLSHITFYWFHVSIYNLDIESKNIDSKRAVPILELFK